MINAVEEEVDAAVMYALLGVFLLPVGMVYVVGEGASAAVDAAKKVGDFFDEVEKEGGTFFKNMRDDAKKEFFDKVLHLKSQLDPSNPEHKAFIQKLADGENGNNISSASTTSHIEQTNTNTDDGAGGNEPVDAMKVVGKIDTGSCCGCFGEI